MLSQKKRKIIRKKIEEGRGKEGGRGERVEEEDGEGERGEGEEQCYPNFSYLL